MTAQCQVIIWEECGKSSHASTLQLIDYWPPVTLHSAASSCQHSEQAVEDSNRLLSEQLVGRVLESEARANKAAETEL
jgi:hypothetical protein